MKKIVSTALLLALALTLALALASCGGPNSDEDDAVRGLNAAGYDVETLETTVEGFEVDVVYAVKGDDFIIIYYFDEKADAKVYFERFENDLKEAAPEGTDFECGRDGDVVYVGTEAAIKATNGK